MDGEGEVYPFFYSINARFSKINADPEAAIDELIARDAVFYKKTLFRAFLNYTEQECEEMSMQKYIDSNIVLTGVLKLWHAPYLDKKDG